MYVCTGKGTRGGSLQGEVGSCDYDWRGVVEKFTKQTTFLFIGSLEEHALPSVDFAIT